MNVCKKIYRTSDGFDDMIMFSDGKSLTGLIFSDSTDKSKFGEGEERNLPVFGQTEEWLDAYFSGRDPGAAPPIDLGDLSEFRKRVTELMLEIPYGSTRTYGEIAATIAAERGVKRMSAQAVGGAVGANPVCIIVPCHRVMGAGGKLTGYGGGIQNKIALLKLEGVIK